MQQEVLAENVVFPLTKGKEPLAIDRYRLDRDKRQKIWEQMKKYFPSSMFFKTGRSVRVCSLCFVLARGTQRWFGS